jgi:hypothetical protein
MAELNNEPYLYYIGTMLNSTSFQNILLLAEAEELAFEQAATNDWRSFPARSSVRASGAAKEAHVVLWAQNRFGVKTINNDDVKIFGA